MKVLFTITLLGLLFVQTVSSETFKILQVNSYGSDWIWIKEQTTGFTQGIGDVDYELKTVDLDAKNKNNIEVHQMATYAIKLAAEWKPDLVFLTDDLAQSEVAIALISSGVPIVYCGVNKNPEDYGFDKATNVCGVLEREHTTATMNLLKSLVPGKKLKVAIVIDNDPTWIGVVGRMKNEILSDNDLELIRVAQPETFEEFKKTMTELQKTADVIGMLGVFRFTDSGGKLVDYEIVLRWTVENSVVPDFSFWDTRIERGTLCAVTVSGIEQGKAAGILARRILVDDISPKDLPVQTTTKGVPMISLSRAKKLGMKVNSSILLNTRVISHYIWEK